MTEKQRVAAQTRKAPAKEPPRRTASFVRPYLSRLELGAVLATCRASNDGGLLDPSLATAIEELARWEAN